MSQQFHREILEREKKWSYNVMDDEPVIYEFSEIEIQNLKIAVEKRPRFYGVENLDDNTKVSALKASSFVVSLVSFPGASVFSQNCGAIIERDGVVVYASDDSWYLREIIFSDFSYNLAVVKFRSKSFFEPVKLSMIDDASVSETNFLRCDSSKSKHGDNVIIVGCYFQGANEYMAPPGVLSLSRFRPEEYDCNELFTISSRFTRCGDGASVISTSGELLGITFFDIGTSSPLLPINLINRMWDHFKEHGGMTNATRNSSDTSYRFRRLFPNVLNGLIDEKVLKDYNAESTGLQVGDVIFACDGIEIKSFVQLWELMFAKVGKEVQLEVARVDLKVIKKIRLLIGVASIDEEIYG
ncbi:hypothetical protein OROMI_015427 [Orobanche minor]